MEYPDSLISIERIDPLLVKPEDVFNQETLRLHLERYEFAVPYVKGKSVIDCACGTGYGSEMLERGGARSVIGVDISDEALDFARRFHAHAQVEFCQGDALTFKPLIPPDVWVTLETVEHLDDPMGYLDAIHGRLAPGGLLIASVPSTVSTDGNPFHRHDFTGRSWRAMVERAGFKIENELQQSQRFTLKDIFGHKRGARQTVQRSLIHFYLTHPRVAVARVSLTLTKGLVNEYLVVAARRV